MSLRTFFRIRIVFLVAGLTFVMSVGAPAQEQPPQPQTQRPADPVPVRPDEAKIDASGAGAAVDPRTYKIGIQDVIGVRVWRENELSGNFVVRPDGKISMPLAGEIDADSATPDELKGRIVTALSGFMNRPEVTLEVRQVNSKRYYITGEVGKTGAYTIISPITILEALSNAGGLKDFANGKKIVIMRGNERLKFNYKEVIKGKKMDQNIQLQPGDHIIVP